jgi:hypothetical protein
LIGAIFSVISTTAAVLLSVPDAGFARVALAAAGFAAAGLVAAGLVAAGLGAGLLAFTVTFDVAIMGVCLS